MHFNELFLLVLPGILLWKLHITRKSSYLLPTLGPKLLEVWTFAEIILSLITSHLDLNGLTIVLPCLGLLYGFSFGVLMKGWLIFMTLIMILHLRNLRKLFRVESKDYMSSICESGDFRELPSPGKSGCVFYLSHDELFMIKTLRKAEVKV